MKKNRILTLLLAFIMLLSIFPFNVLAEVEKVDENTKIEEVVNSKEQDLLKSIIVAIEKAENTKSKEDTEVARNLLETLEDSELKTELLARIDAIKAIEKLSKDEEVKNVDNTTEELIEETKAENLEEKFAENEKEPVFSIRSSQEEIEAAEKAVKAAEDVAPSKNSINQCIKAKELVDALDESPEKTALLERLKKIYTPLKKITLTWEHEGKNYSHVLVDIPNNIGELKGPYEYTTEQKGVDIKKTKIEVELEDSEAVLNTEIREVSIIQRLFITTFVSEGGIKQMYGVTLNTPEKVITKEEKINNIVEHLKKKYEGTYEDWSAMAMAAMGLGDKVNETSLITVAKKVAEERKSSTDLERITISLTSLGYDVTKFVDTKGNHLNLIDLISNYKQGEYGTALGTLNGYIFALIAYDSGSYEVANNADWTREKIIDYILNNRLPSGGWNLNNEGASDVDITAMAIQALAPYYKADNRVKVAVDGALKFLKTKQITNGSYKGAFSGWGVSENANSTAMVAVAVSALGRNLDTDPQFMVGETSLLDGLLSFATLDNEFGYTDNVRPNGMATEQAFRALISYLKKSNVYIFPKPTKSLATVVTPEAIEITEMPKTEYTVGDPIDLSGLRARIKFTDGTTKIVGPYDLTVQGLDTETSGNKLVIIGYAGLSTTIWVKVNDKPIVPVDPNNPANPDQPAGKVAYISVIVPPGPTIMTSGKVMQAKKAFPIEEGKDTAFSLLQKTGLRYLYNYHKIYEGVYVSSIEGLAEFDGGPQSGWMYRVNGKFPNFSSSLYKVKPGDYVEWLYTRDLGKDVGGYVDGVEFDDGTGQKIAFVTAKAEEGGSIAPSGKVKISSDSPVTFTIKPDEGYVTIDVIVDGKSIGPVSSFTATVNNVEKEGTILAKFKKSSELTEAEKKELEKKKLEAEEALKKDDKKSTAKGIEAFTDIKDHWAYENIKFVYEKGLFKGLSETKFGPESKMTRGMFVTVLGRIEKVDITQNNTKFTDVSQEQYYAPYVKWASDNNIVAGVGENQFQPNREITREEMSKIIDKYLEYKKYNYKAEKEIDIKDVEDISDWAKASVERMYKEDILKGKEDGNFYPKALSTRAEVATVIKRIYEKINSI